MSLAVTGLILIKLCISITILLYSNIVALEIINFCKLQRRLPNWRYNTKPSLHSGLCAVVAIIYNLNIECPKTIMSYDTASVIEIQLFLLVLGVSMLDTSAARCYVTQRWREQLERSLPFLNQQQSHGAD